MLAGHSDADSRKRGMELLEALDVAHRASAMPSQLSGGEQQRISIARALANHPPVILADEPTAPLDSERALSVVRILHSMAQQYETAIIVVTHDEEDYPDLPQDLQDPRRKDGGRGRGGQTDGRRERSLRRLPSR